MSIDKTMRSQILSEALPYIQMYSGKTIVIKYGGAAMIDPNLKKAVLSDIVLLSQVGIRIVIVHGGGPHINEWLKKMDIQPKFIDGLRYTDEETMAVVQMTLAGKVGKELAAYVHEHGGKAVSICGLDGGLMQGTQIDEQYGQVGRLESVNPALINHLLDDGYIPIISTIATSLKEKNQVYNINADTAAGEVAVALKAARLMLLTDVAGILRDKLDKASLITQMSVSDIPKLVQTGVITDGMIPKIQCAELAIRRGVERALILDGRVPHSILMEIFTDEGMGTMITG